MRFYQCFLLLLFLLSCQNLSRDMTLRQAYLATDYQVYPNTSDTLHIRADQLNPTLDQFLKTQKTWAYITAWNPNSEPLSAEENTQRNQQLIESLQAIKYTFYHGKGVPDIGDWQPEESFLVLDISKKQAIEIGRRYGQKAILWGQKGGVAELIFCFEAT